MLAGREVKFSAAGQATAYRAKHIRLATESFGGGPWMRLRLRGARVPCQRHPNRPSERSREPRQIRERAHGLV